ncbi:MAG: CYTH domain-containing protein [Lachnospiraceae bacterium]|nr:CYTH domain-containing protein [Lachnospiraceae bacterium]
MEIERKFLIEKLPENLDSYEHTPIVQAYLNTEPVLRIRKRGEKYTFTYKGSGLMVREEYNLPLTAEAFEHLLPKADGNIIRKTRYLIPLDDLNYVNQSGESSSSPLVVELDIFTSPKELIMAEVEFPDEAAAGAFIKPDWFGAEVTNDPAYHNSNMI